MNAQRYEGVISTLLEIKEDLSMPRNVQQRIENTIKILSDPSLESSTKKSKAISELEYIGEEEMLQTDTRTQLFNIMGMLEGI